MQILSASRGCVLAIVLVVGMVARGGPAAGQSTSNSESPSPPEPLPSPPPSARGDEIFADLVKHNDLRTAALRQYAAVRTYAVTDLSGKVHAKQTVQMEYIAPDKKTFKTLSEEGSSVVRHLVLNRLVESEISAASGKEHHDSSIAPANYTFHPIGEEDLGSHHCLIVEAIPNRRDKYLFEGKVWIDSSDFAVVKIAGHPAKKLSFWITRADFVRQYEKIGDFWLPARDETLVEVRLYGKKILRIEHHINTVNGVTSAVSMEQNPPAIAFSDKASSH